MQVEPFAVEEWMSTYEHKVEYNLAETCVKPFRLKEFLALVGVEEIPDMQLTYGHIPGSPALRTELARLYHGQHPNNILIEGGAIGANFLVFYTLVEPGDTVISIFPTYEQLYRVAESFGATVKRWVLRRENDFLPDPDDLKRLIDGRTKLIVINNPHNPSGALIGEELLGYICRLAEDCGAYLLCDEVYRGLYLEEGVTVPSAVELSARAIATGSFSKAYSLSGLRLGWIAGPQEVIRACQMHRDYTTISCNMISDWLATLALHNLNKVMARNLTLLRNNFRIVDDWVAEEMLVSYVSPRAGTTAFLQYHLDVPSRQLCESLVRGKSTFLVPGQCFEMEGYLRLGYACDTEVLKTGLARLQEHLHSYI